MNDTGTNIGLFEVRKRKALLLKLKRQRGVGGGSWSGRRGENNECSWLLLSVDELGLGPVSPPTTMQFEQQQSAHAALPWCPYFGSNNVLDINMTMDNLMEKEKEVSLGISVCEIFYLTVVTETDKTPTSNSATRE